MRFALALLLALAACGDPFAAAQKADTIEAYEHYLAENPTGRFHVQARGRLESLYLENARAEKTLEAFDRYLERFPEGALRDKVLEEREVFLFDWAREVNTFESWTRFLDEYPRAERKRRTHARRMVGVHSYLEHLALGEPTFEEVNLAEDPKGPKDGWGFAVEVTNNGPETIESLWLTVEYLDEQGRSVESDEWPVVAPQWPIPMEESAKVPMKPKESRRWYWMTGSVPQAWAKKVRVHPTRIQLRGKAQPG